jgi:hypothetical protein
MEIRVRIRIGINMEIWMRIRIGINIEIWMRIRIGINMEIWMRIRIGINIEIWMRIRIGINIEIRMQIRIGIKTMPYTTLERILSFLRIIQCDLALQTGQSCPRRISSPPQSAHTQTCPQFNRIT